MLVVVKTPNTGQPRDPGCPRNQATPGFWHNAKRICSENQLPGTQCELANSLTLDDSLPARSLNFLLYEMEVFTETQL